uniref:Uncharacterized protein n=1 Tax=Panagrolaimus sp. PS1159 TaxID=55785 RepID=A0AC35GAS0_9BILA
MHVHCHMNAKMSFVYFQIIESVLSDISADNSVSSKGRASSTDTPANIPLASFSSQEPYTSVSSTTVSASATETDGFSLSVSSLASTDTPLSLPTMPTAITTKSKFDFKIPCFFGFCLNEYVCKNFWCVRPNSTSVSTTIFTSEAPASESTVKPRFETAKPTVITERKIYKILKDFK